MVLKLLMCDDFFTKSCVVGPSDTLGERPCEVDSYVQAHIDELIKMFQL